jgi:RNA polymerase sigma-70 factor, ECF subfamily
VTEQRHEDRQLIDAILAGDQEQFRALVEREAAPVTAICRRILGDPVDAQDVAQEAFLKAYRGLATFRGEAPFSAWLRRIAIHAAIARLAARREEVRLDADYLDPRAASLESGDDPEMTALGLEERAAVVEAVRTLPDAQQEAILLRFFGDLSLQEIAASIDMPVGTVKSRLHRGLAALREHLEPRSAR